MTEESELAEHPYCPECGRHYASVTKHQVIALHRKNPTWNSIDIAKHLGCTSAYVRATAQRNDLVLPTKYRKR